MDAERSYEMPSIYTKTYGSNKIRQLLFRALTKINGSYSEIDFVIGMTTGSKYIRLERPGESRRKTFDYFIYIQIRI